MSNTMECTVCICNVYFSDIQIYIIVYTWYLQCAQSLGKLCQIMDSLPALATIEALYQYADLDYTPAKWKERNTENILIFVRAKCYDAYFRSEHQESNRLTYPACFTIQIYIHDQAAIYTNFFYIAWFCSTFGSGRATVASQSLTQLLPGAQV